MRWQLIAIAASLVVAGTLGAVVFAQLSDTQTSSGTVSVTSTSADLYICEPDSTPGPDCGSDDSAADETVFETLEDMRPGDVVQWDIRLKAVGTEDWIVNEVTLSVVETTDPGADCPDNVLQDARHPTAGSESPFSMFGGEGVGVFILGKNGDDLNDNPTNVSGLPRFVREFNPFGSPQFVNIKVAAGDYEDVRLRLELNAVGTENCDGNEWNVSWVFTVQ